MSILHAIAIRSRRQAAAEYCRANGIDFELWHGALGILKGNHRAGRFEQDGEGRSSAAIPVVDEYDQAIDAVAWPVDAPETFGTAFGLADALGMATVVNPATWAFGGALHIFRTPLQWLQAGCDGCCILDFRALPSWLGKVPGSIAVEDVEHARIIHDALNPRFEKRRILVRRDPLEHAA